MCYTLFCTSVFHLLCISWRPGNFRKNTISTSKKSTDNNCWRGVEKRLASHTDGGNVNWYSHGREQYGGS